MALRQGTPWARACILAAALSLTAAAQAQNVPATNAPITNPPNLILPPAATMPDLWLPSPLITATCAQDKTVTIEIKATFKNIGKGPATFANNQTIATSSWGPESGAKNLVEPGKQPVKTTALGPATIAKGASHTVHLQIIGLSRYKPMSKPGTYVAGATIDPGKAVPELNEHNNGVGGYVNDPCFGK